MEIRHLQETDLPSVFHIYQTARALMAQTGNPNQWKKQHPKKELLYGDIQNQTGYVIVDEQQEIVGVFAFIIGEDPTYQIIEGGCWLNNQPYGTIHRIASSGKVKNIFEIALAYCQKQIDNIRIDTHPDNQIMQHKIGKNGFQYCGVIYVEDGSKRWAYQKTRG